MTRGNLERLLVTEGDGPQLSPFPFTVSVHRRISASPRTRLQSRISQNESSVNSRGPARRLPAGLYEAASQVAILSAWAPLLYRLLLVASLAGCGAESTQHADVVAPIEAASAPPPPDVRFLVNLPAVVLWGAEQRSRQPDADRRTRLSPVQSWGSDRRCAWRGRRPSGGPKLPGQVTKPSENEVSYSSAALRSLQQGCEAGARLGYILGGCRAPGYGAELQSIGSST